VIEIYGITLMHIVDVDPIYGKDKEILATSFAFWDT
jgi:hypothetical protein